MARDSRRPHSLSPVTVVEAVPAQSERSRGVLMVIGGQQTGRVLSLSVGPSVTIGRSAKATHTIDEPSVSSIHARIIRAEPRYILADEQATNGTFVNGERLTEPANLTDGDRVQLGPVLVLRFTLVSEAEERSLKMVYESAHRDGLTGVFNRKHIEERLDAEIAYADRHGKALSVIMLDLDHFKKINDEHGHQAGDETLRVVGSIMQRGSRVEDIVGRYGGEEFVIVVRDTSGTAAAVVAERVRSQITQAKIEYGGRTLSVTASAGVASLACCGEKKSRETIIRIADERLYQAKLRGRNRVVGPSEMDARGALA
jgi:two-component system, cell cycle response regulator